jgi:hypothetical protein
MGRGRVLMSVSVSMSMSMSIVPEDCCGAFLETGKD